jgi:hypothetical protein
VRGFGVGCEVNVHGAEQHPFAAGRGRRLADALERHHVFEGKGVFGLGEEREGEQKSKDENG